MGNRDEPSVGDCLSHKQSGTKYSDCSSSGDPEWSRQTEAIGNVARNRGRQRTAKDFSHQRTQTDRGCGELCRNAFSRNQHECQRCDSLTTIGYKACDCQ